MTPLSEQPAFPFICNDVSKNQVVEGGMTYRQWLAGMAMQGILRDNDASPTMTATLSVKFADALIQELEK